MTEQTNTPTEELEELPLDQKLAKLFSVVVDNNNMLKALMQVLDQFSRPASHPVGVPYQPGYPANAAPGTRPLNDFSNAYSEASEYSSPDEPYRSERTYTQMPTPPQAQQGAPPHHPPPTPPGGMPPQQQSPPPSVGGERVMTPDEFREAHPE